MPPHQHALHAPPAAPAPVRVPAVPPPPLLHASAADAQLSLPQNAIAKALPDQAQRAVPPLQREVVDAHALLAAYQVGDR